jgi:hypothetical protein
VTEPPKILWKEKNKVVAAIGCSNSPLAIRRQVEICAKQAFIYLDTGIKFPYTMKYIYFRILSFVL